MKNESKCLKGKGHRFIKGQSASGGIVMGTAILISPALNKSQAISPADANLLYTLDNFHLAIQQTRDQLIQFQRNIQERIAEPVAQIFAAHLAILDDAQFTGRIQKNIEEGKSVVEAIRNTWQDNANIFSHSPNTRLKEKVQDLTDITNRILQNLAHPLDVKETANYQGKIVIIPILFPSDILRLVAQKAEGVIFSDSGITAHVTIIARSLELPMILADSAFLGQITNETPLLLDANQGTIIINPDTAVIAGYRNLLKTRGRTLTGKHDVLPQTYTKDGRRIHLLAAIGLVSEANVAREMQAEGIGLYRSEFPFLIRDGFPTEDEQYIVYRRIMEDMNGREIVFRTLDIGGDKILRYFPMKTESNPFLGLRGLPLTIRHQDIFNTQIRALLRASFDRPLKIMLPLVSSVDSFLYAKGIIQSIFNDMKSHAIPLKTMPEIGVMIELPCAVLMANELSAEADFLSIGTNDLVQYMLSIDRTNEQLAGWYTPWHPAIIRAISMVVEAANRHGKPVSVCGEMANTEELIPILIGMGLTYLTIPPNLIPQVQKLIRGISSVAAEKLAKEVIACPTVIGASKLIGLKWKHVWENNDGKGSVNSPVSQ